MVKEIEPSNLIVTVIGPDQDGLLNAFARICKLARCNILDSRAVQMSGAFTLILQLQGTWDALAKIEAKLPAFQKKWGCETLIHRPDQAKVPDKHMPYSLQVVTIDRVGILNDISRFFHQHGILVHQLSTEVYYTHHCPTKMCNISGTVLVPVHFNISNIRDQFLSYCEEHNLDAMLEPQKLG